MRESGVRALARQTLRRLGFQRIHHPPFVDLMRREGIGCVFDVGANVGHYGVELREHGFTGHIISFEPIASAYASLARRAAADGQWDAFRLALGDGPGELSLAVTAADVFSSFKPPTQYTAGKFVGARETHRETVTVERLDRLLADHPDWLGEGSAAYLKIDTQGFEREVLEGAGDMLARFKAVQLELPLRQLYEGQDDWLVMIEWMAVRGFGVAMAKENGFDWDAMRLLELDVVFIRND